MLGEDRSKIQKNSCERLSRIKNFKKFTGKTLARKHKIGEHQGSLSNKSILEVKYIPEESTFSIIK